MSTLPHDYFTFCIGTRAMALLDRMFPSVIHVVVDLQGPLDPDRLRQAWELLPAQHPLLTATIRPFRDKQWTPGSSAPLEFRLAVEEDLEKDPGPQEIGLLNEHLDLTTGPPARLALIQRGETTRLLVSVHHSLCDARSVVNLTDDLRQHYLRLAKDEAYTPEVDTTSRYLLTVLREIDFPKDVQKRLIKKARRLERHLPRSRHREPNKRKQAQRQAGQVTYRPIHLEADLLARLRPARLEQGWTLNDVLQGLLERAWIQAVGPPRGRRPRSCWMVAADQRPRLGTMRGFGVVSSLEFIWLTPESDDPARAVQSAHQIMSERKADWPGLGTLLNAYSMQRFLGPRSQTAAIRMAMRLALSLLRYTRIFTNLGDLGDRLADWGEARASHAYCLAPIPTPGFTLFTGSGFQGRTTIAVGYTPPWFSDEQLDRLEQSLREGLETLAHQPAPSPFLST